MERQHPIATMLKTIQRDEIRYCSECCPEKISQPTTLLTAARLQMRQQRMRTMWRVQIGSELQRENPYIDMSRYAKWLICMMDFYGISHVDCTTTMDLERKYAEIFAF